MTSVAVLERSPSEIVVEDVRGFHELGVDLRLRLLVDRQGLSK